MYDAWRLLDRVGFDPTHPYFFGRLALGESFPKLRYVLPLWDMSFEFYGEVRGGECHIGKGVRTSNRGSSLHGDEEFSL
jgi:hypothetical protein